MNRTYCIFILSHERANKLYTYNMLINNGIEKKHIYIVVDDEDKQKNIYRQKFKNVLIYNKDEIQKETDTVDSFYDLKKTGLFARNFIMKKAKELGYNYCIMLDDDYKHIKLKYICENKVKSKNINNLNVLFNMCIEYMDGCSQIDFISFCGEGDYFGGKESMTFKRGLIRKAVNVFIFKSDCDIKFLGRINDDICTNVLYQSKGRLFLSIGNIMLDMCKTMKIDGGMFDLYKQCGDYVKSFYPIIVNPSCTIISDNLYHKVYKNNCCPKIVSERYKK